MKNRGAHTGKQETLACWPFIEEALDDGWSVTAIWHALHSAGHIRMGYNQFRLHVRRIGASKKPRHADATHPLGARVEETSGPFIHMPKKRKGIGQALTEDARSLEELCFGEQQSDGD